MVYHLDSFSCFFLEGLRMRVSARFPLLFYTFLNRLDFALFIPPVGVCLGLPLKSQHGAFLAVYGGQPFGFFTGDITLPSSFSKQHSV